jgi:hypothetical protein
MKRLDPYYYPDDYNVVMASLIDGDTAASLRFGQTVQFPGSAYPLFCMLRENSGDVPSRNKRRVVSHAPNKIAMCCTHLDGESIFFDSPAEARLCWADTLDEILHAALNLPARMQWEDVATRLRELGAPDSVFGTLHYHFNEVVPAKPDMAAVFFVAPVSDHWLAYFMNIKRLGSLSTSTTRAMMMNNMMVDPFVQLVFLAVLMVDAAMVHVGTQSTITRGRLLSECFSAIQLFAIPGTEMLSPQEMQVPMTKLRNLCRLQYACPAPTAVELACREKHITERYFDNCYNMYIESAAQENYDQKKPTIQVLAIATQARTEMDIIDQGICSGCPLKKTRTTPKLRVFAVENAADAANKIELLDATIALYTRGFCNSADFFIACHAQALATISFPMDLRFSLGRMMCDLEKDLPASDRRCWRLVLGYPAPEKVTLVLPYSAWERVANLHANRYLTVKKLPRYHRDRFSDAFHIASVFYTGKFHEVITQFSNVLISYMCKCPERQIKRDPDALPDNDHHVYMLPTILHHLFPGGTTEFTRMFYINAMTTPRDECLKDSKKGWVGLRPLFALPQGRMAHPYTGLVAFLSDSGKRRAFYSVVEEVRDALRTKGLVQRACQYTRVLMVSTHPNQEDVEHYSLLDEFLSSLLACDIRKKEYVTLELSPAQVKSKRFDALRGGIIGAWYALAADVAVLPLVIRRHILFSTFLKSEIWFPAQQTNERLSDATDFAEWINNSLELSKMFQRPDDVRTTPCFLNSFLRANAAANPHPRLCDLKVPRRVRVAPIHNDSTCAFVMTLIVSLRTDALRPVPGWLDYQSRDMIIDRATRPHVFRDKIEARLRDQKSDQRFSCNIFKKERRNYYAQENNLSWRTTAENLHATRKHNLPLMYDKNGNTLTIGIDALVMVYHAVADYANVAGSPMDVPNTQMWEELSCFSSLSLSYISLHTSSAISYIRAAKASSGCRTLERMPPRKSSIANISQWYFAYTMFYQHFTYNTTKRTPHQWSYSATGRTLFKYLSMSDLYALSLVCQRWRFDIRELLIRHASM